jgi:multidrug efflux pump
MFSRFFIERPVFAAVISIIIVLAGLVAMRALPIEQYPTIIPVQVTVNTTYLGADSRRWPSRSPRLSRRKSSASTTCCT